MTNYLQELKHIFDNKYQLLNSYIFGWESDYFGISKSGYIYEIELKISRSDFKADFKKTLKHSILQNAKKEWIVESGRVKEALLKKILAKIPQLNTGNP